MGWVRVVAALAAAIVIAGCGSGGSTTHITVGLPPDDLASAVNRYCRDSAAQPTPAADTLGGGSLYSQKGAAALDELVGHVERLSSQLAELIGEGADQEALDQLISYLDREVELVRQAAVAIRAGDTAEAKDLMGQQADLDRELSRLVKSRGWNDCT